MRFPHPFHLRRPLLARSFSIAPTPCSPASQALPNFATISLSSPAPHVVTVALNRPEKLNAMNKVTRAWRVSKCATCDLPQTMWADLRSVFAFLSASPDCRAIILTGSGRGFTAGLDLHDHVDLFAPNSQPGSDAARQALAKLPLIASYQDSVSSLERARVPVIAAIHGPCVGGGVDLICAADIRSVLHSRARFVIRNLTMQRARLASSDAWFCIAETRLGLAADVGTLQVRGVFFLLIISHRTLSLHTPCSDYHALSVTPLSRVNGHSHPEGSQPPRSAALSPLCFSTFSSLCTYIQALQAGLLSR
jgi:enoyl-CoA hydratase/carnithine racemase